jgi:hypothetical protein
MERKDGEQASSVEGKAEDQEHDARLAASAKLLAEMESLLNRAKSVYTRHIENLEKLKNT